MTTFKELEKAKKVADGELDSKPEKIWLDTPSDSDEQKRILKRNQFLAGMRELIKGMDTADLKKLKKQLVVELSTRKF